MTGSKRLVAFAAIAWTLACAAQAQPEERRPLERTLSYEMLQIESTVRSVPRDKVLLLKSALDRATYAAAAKYTTPRNRRQAIDSLDAIQIAFAEHNFILPTSRRDWKDTIGDALEPLNLTREERRLLLAPGEVNGFRARYINPVRPLYFVNDSIGSQLIISVGQRFGWEMHLVSADERYFVRWHIRPGLWINWDWTAGGPTRNEDYSLEEGNQYRDWPERRRDLRSLSPGYARAQYLYQLARHVTNPSGRRGVLETAMIADATHESVQNSLAWIYATDPRLPANYRRKAVQYALSAWAAGPRDPFVTDTVACAYGGIGEGDLGVEIQRFAIARLREMRRERLIPEFEARMRQIQNGNLCTG
jgi:hypothetical protein